MNEDKFKVHIAWGLENENRFELDPNDPDIDWHQYSFETEGELAAFLRGVDESSGWMEYTVRPAEE